MCRFGDAVVFLSYDMADPSVTFSHILLFCNSEQFLFDFFVQIIS